MFIKITVESGQKTASSYVPTRTSLGLELDQDLVARMVAATAETLTWLSLGYPERDMLEMEDPWATDHAGESEPDLEDILVKDLAGKPAQWVKCRCGADALGFSRGKWLCRTTKQPIDVCDGIAF